MSQDHNMLFGAVVFFGVVFAGIAAFINHWIWVIKAMTDGIVTFGDIFMALFGFFVPPFAVIHGAWLWFV